MAAGTINVELSHLSDEAHAMANENERALAACAGHDFIALNTRLRNSNYECRHCRGVVDCDAAARHGARMNPGLAA